VEDAMVQLSFSYKKAANPLLKVLKSAVANAEHNHELKSEHLFVKEIRTDMGRVMKRYMPRARGSAFTIRRRMAHISVILEERAAKTTRKSLFARSRREEKPKEATVPGAAEQEKGAVTEKQQSAPKGQKTGEQRKMNQVQQKRRMFTRKTGE
jgi:large subunit ribosomal protein L22